MAFKPNKDLLKTQVDLDYNILSNNSNRNIIIINTTLLKLLKGDSKNTLSNLKTLRTLKT
jgi:hypothetical protein